MKKILLALCLLAASFCVAQTNIDTLAIQDFEVAPMAPAWNFTGPVIYNSGFSAAGAAPANSPIGIGGSRAWETTTNSGGLQLVFDNVTVPAGYDSVRVHFNLAAMSLSSSSGGPDDLDWVLTEYSLDGGTTYTGRLRIRGAVNNNSFWPYSATGVAKVNHLPATEALFQPVNSGLQTTLGYSNCEIVFPGSVTQVRIRVTARSSSSTDTWLVDNLLITGENNCVNTTSSFSATACGSFTAPSGTVYTSSGTYNDVIPNAAGCDSTITINLTVNSNTGNSIGPDVCDSYTSPAGNVYLASGIYYDTLVNAAGCDSIILINLVVRNSTNSSITVVECGSYTTPGGSTLTSTGIYTDIIPNMAGCDSTIVIDLTINTVDTSASVSGVILTANANGASYQWMDCNTNAIIPGATAQSYTATANGSYAVIVTENGCTDTSSCMLVLSTGTEETDLSAQLIVLPGQTPGMFTATLAQPLAGATATVTDVQGKIIFREGAISGTAFNIDLTAQSAGVYFLEVRDSNRIARVKIMKR